MATFAANRVSMLALEPELASRCTVGTPGR